MKNIGPLLAHYGELQNPDSMLYENQNGERLIEIFASDKLPERDKQALLAEIDQLIRKHYTIKNTDSQGDHNHD